MKITDTIYRCSKCKEEKDISEFYPDRSELNNRPVTGWCIPCNKVRSKEWNKNNREQAREYQLKLKFNLTQDEYDVMLQQQNGVCKICKKTCFRAFLAVDHDHDTGKIRGLLCFKCNTGLGKFDDDPEQLHTAALYLKEWMKGV